jgi:hypothetical protein
MQNYFFKYFSNLKNILKHIGPDPETYLEICEQQDPVDPVKIVRIHNSGYRINTVPIKRPGRQLSTHYISIAEPELQGAETFGRNRNEVSAPALAPGWTKLLY